MKSSFRRRPRLSSFTFIPVLALALLGGEAIEADDKPATEPVTPHYKTTAEADDTLAGQQARQDQAIRLLHEHINPPSGVPHYIAEAISDYWLDDGPGGDKALKEMKSEVLAGTGKDAKDDEDTQSLNWTALRIARIIFLFGSHGTRHQGLMSAATEAETKQLLWKWLDQRARMALVDPSKDWWVFGSENITLTNWCSMWSILTLLAKDPDYQERKLSDGSSVPELKAAFDDYFKRWIRHRVTRGMFAEFGSPGYIKYSLSVFYNLSDFADDPELSKLSREFLDFYWTYFALEQIDGCRGGSRHRSKAGEPSIIGGEVSMSWYHFGIGAGPDLGMPALVVATTNYFPPPLVVEILKERDQLGEYEITSRLVGHLDPGFLSQEAGKAAPLQFVQNAPAYPYNSKLCVLDSHCSATLRKTYAAPGFIIGSTMEPAQPHTNWAGFSTSYRWDGAIFEGPCSSVQPQTGEGRPRIFVQPKFPGKTAHYNAEWSVQNKGVLIIQRLPSQEAHTQRVFFSQELIPVEKEGWIFVEAAKAYVAVKVADGKWHWEPDAPDYWRNSYVKGMGQWLAPEDEFSPIVMEVVSKDKYAGFDAFQKEILRNPLEINGTSVAYQSTHYDTKLTLFADRSQSPQIDGQTVNYEPASGFSGGIIESAFGGNEIHVNVFGKQHVFDF